MNTPERTRARVKDARRQLEQSRDYRDKQVAEAEHIRKHVREHMPMKD